VQAGTVLFDNRRTIQKLESFCGQAAERGARLVLFPEAYLGGYPKGITFGAAVGSRSPEGRDQFRAYYESAIDVPGPETAQIGEFVAGLGIELVLGAIERAGGTLFCSVLFFGPDGQLRGKHRKLMPTASERLIWGMGDGSTMPVIETEGRKIGAAICWENYMPLFRTAMYAKGVNIWCAPTVDDREVWQSTMQHIALEGRCFVLSACQYLQRSDCPAWYHPIQGDDPGTVLIGGGSVIVSPLGQVLAGPARNGEQVLTAELDMGDIARGKFDLDVVGHYARPDIFQLSVEERPKPPVTYGD
jgi:predicted amidohydrolase